MCARYSQAVQDLAKAEHGWHFGAMHTQPEQIRDFKIEDMAHGMQTVAPQLWSLVLVVILSILMQSRDPHCNALQSTMGIFLHSCNAPEKLTKVLSRMGLSISLPSIHRAVRSLSQRSCQDIQLLGRSLLTSYAFDNFDVLLKVLVHTVDGAQGGLVHLTSGALFQLQQVELEDLRCSKLVWERSELNPHASNPRSLTDPEPVDPIPIAKTHYLPLRAMDINQSTVAGNIKALGEMFRQAGVGDPHLETNGETPPVDIREYMTIVFGDLGTYERIMSALRRRSVERTPYNRLQSVAFGIGYFHVKMAATDTVWRLVVNPVNARQDDTSFMKTAGELRPNESSRLVSGATFRQQHELIGHVGILLRLDAWRTEVKRRNPSIKSLEAWADTKPSLAEINDIAECLVRDYVEGEGLDLFALAMQSEQARDQVRENTMRLHNYLLLYEELSYAMNAGDIGRLESLLALWIPLFRAAGKHKYGNYTLRFMHDLFKIYPEGLRQAIRMNILVNPTGRPHEFRAVDWVIELLNLLIKVIYGGEGSNYTKERILLESVLVRIFRNSHANMEQNFALSGLTTRHAKKNMKKTFDDILKRMEERGPNEYRARRKSQYVIPDALMKGAAMIEKEGGVSTLRSVVFRVYGDGENTDVQKSSYRGRNGRESSATRAGVDGVAQAEADRERSFSLSSRLLFFGWYRGQVGLFPAMGVGYAKG
ncbi:hypothetical protein DICSQDRAFT_145419 [Dichomitus squalens LYAD-421 SS1]|uniref:uncharacterized protein n=1 Tax=Dichomitus squalens (strain LYAD-421) TaxID=732165 RepID=UPI0004411399|nr:uncharacterized protein DICSQDRAFT_145419 [Dichomitus squalens LYAD-421 SS1]EJF63965.1 hypothetical protein DICSQDRAFT_145419 [Dichomitus squalens LYAD-421 SS1]